MRAIAAKFFKRISVGTVRLFSRGLPEVGDRKLMAGLSDLKRDDVTEAIRLTDCRLHLKLEYLKP
jgi:hypothetical protein